MLENPPQHEHPDVRASLLITASRPGRELRVWMGGAHTPIGARVTDDLAARAVIFDCAGDLPTHLREAALRVQPCVFLDVEERPALYPRLQIFVQEILYACERPGGPTDVIALCTHGMNRSGLVAGLLLRGLGHSPEDAISLIRAARPGALSNQSFVRLLSE